MNLNWLAFHKSKGDRQKRYLPWEAGRLPGFWLDQIKGETPEMLCKTRSVFGNAHCFYNVPNRAMASETGSLHCVRSISVGTSRFWFLQQSLYGLSSLEARTNIGMESGGIAYWTHAGGFIFGAILGPLLGLFSDKSTSEPWYDS